jgi:hypothetical protein
MWEVENAAESDANHGYPEMPATFDIRPHREVVKAVHFLAELSRMTLCWGLSRSGSPGIAVDSRSKST